MADAVRTRTRRDTGLGEPGQTPQATPEMVEKAKAAYQANKAKNKHGRDEGAAIKALEQMMAQAGDLRSFTFRVGAVNVDVTYGPTKSEHISVERLLKHVDAAAVLKVAKVTKGDVVAQFGSNVAAACTVETPGDYKVKVKERGKR